MRQNSEILSDANRCSFAIGNTDTVAQMGSVAQLPVFSDEAISFLHDLSKILLKEGKEFSDVATFAFWCRRSSLLNDKKKYDDAELRIGRGTVFHIAPSNVPVNFAFSLATGLLAGNANIVRLPSRDFSQVRIICGAIHDLLSNEHQNLARYISLLRYSHNSEITDIFSSICDTRIIWGGDNTIAEIRKSPIKPKANEITFSDRHSIAVINADAYIQAENKKQIAQDFYNDTYLTDQNACTSPRIVVWLGKEKEKAQEEFWRHIHAMVKEQYTLAPVQSVGKLHAFLKTASQKDVKLVHANDILVFRISVNQLDENLMDYKYNSGFFFEYNAEALHEIIPLCDERCQTLVYYGIEKDNIKHFFAGQKPRGIDRAVPIGKSMDFTLVWDGYDLIRSLSRQISFS